MGPKSVVGSSLGPRVVCANSSCILHAIRIPSVERRYRSASSMVIIFRIFVRTKITSTLSSIPASTTRPTASKRSESQQSERFFLLLLWSHSSTHHEVSGVPTKTPCRRLSSRHVKRNKATQVARTRRLQGSILRIGVSALEIFSSQMFTANVQSSLSNNSSCLSTRVSLALSMNLAVNSNRRYG